MAQDVEILTPEQCWELLAAHQLGRVIFAEDDEIEVFPVNYHVAANRILFRTAPGTKLELVAEHPRVAFETDEQSDDEAWSVIVWGRAARLSLDDEIEQSGVLGLVTWSDDEKVNYVRISPDRVSGRRFARTASDD